VDVSRSDQFRDRAGRQPGALRARGRRVHGAGEVRADAQPHPDPGIHERNAKWSPDGKWIAYVSDRTGEDEIWLSPQDGRGTAVQVTSGSSNYKYQPLWSPDSKKLMWADRAQRLFFVDVDTKAVTRLRPRPHSSSPTTHGRRQQVGRLREAEDEGPSASTCTRSTRSRPRR